MRLPEYLRNKGFWALDFINGGRIRKYYSEIKFLMENYYSDKAKEIRASLLKSILQHALFSVPFYREYAKDLDLSKFPVINKGVVKDSYSLFLSRAFADKKLYSTVTSGSTGTPFKLYQDKNKKLRNIADTIYFSKLAGFEIGQKLVYLKHWNRFNKRNILRRWLDNFIVCDTADLSESNIKVIISLLKNKQEKCVLSYASTLKAIGDYMAAYKSRPSDFNIVSTIAISESLDSQAKERIEKYFSSPVFSRYSNSENGIIAQTCKDTSGEFHINVASYIIEIFDLDKDTPLKEGELGRIIITDLFNYAMPLIRYDTGDLGVCLGSSSCGLKTPVFLRIEGRKTDLLYNTKGELVSSFLLFNEMFGYLEIKQFQFEQCGEKEYLLRLNCPEGFNREEELRENIRKFLGLDASISFVYVKEIALLASRKRKAVINTYRK